MSSGNSLSSFSRLADGIWIPKKMQSRGNTNFRPIFLQNIEGKILFGVLARHISDDQSLYKYICPEARDTWLPRMSGTLKNDMELNTLSQKGQNRTTCNLSWSCQCIQFNSATLNPNGPQLFQLPKQGWRNHNEILQFSLHEIYC